MTLSTEEYMRAVNQLPIKVLRIYVDGLNQHMLGNGPGIGIDQWRDAKESHPEYWNDKGEFDPFINTLKTEP